MTRKLKVYGGNLDGTYQGVIAATSAKHAIFVIEASGGGRMSARYFRDYWCETSNPEQVAVAMAEPGVLFISSYRDRNGYRRQPPKGT